MQTENAPLEGTRRWCAGMLAVVLTAISEYALCSVLAAVYHPAVAQLRDFEAVFAVRADAFMPEPVERLQYVCAVLALPFLVYGWCAFFCAALPRNAGGLKTLSRRLGWTALGAGAAWLLALAITAPYAFYGNFLISTLWLPPASGLANLLNILIGVALGLVAGTYFYRHDALFETCGARLAAYGAFALILLSLAPLEIFGPQLLDNSSHYGMHFEAAFHSVCEVYAGKHLLVDFVNQYGLYPYFLNFLFKLTGLGVVKFTAAMAALSAVAYLAAFGSLRLLLRSRAVAALAVCAVAYFTQLHFTLYSYEHYFQGVPLRFIMPTCAVLLAFLHFYRQSRAAYYGCGLLCAVAVLWNFDTGAVALTSWTLALVYGEALSRGWKGAIWPSARHLAVSAVFFAAVLAAFSLHTKIAAGAWPDFGGFFAYVGYFYGYGFNMYPMRLFHTWNIVALLYAGGLAYAALKLRAGEDSPQAKAVFLLSVLGCGLFAYFQGRSYTPNLLFVSWPAIMIAALGFERMLSLPPDNAAKPPARLAAALLAVALVSTAASSLKIVPFAAHNAVARLLPALQQKGAPALEKIDFIRSNSSPGESVLILSYNAGPFHLYAGTRNPLNLPGFSEIYLKREIDEVAKAVASRKYHVFLDEGVFMHHTDYAREVFMALEENYYIAAQSPAGMAFCLPQPGAPLSGKPSL